MTLFCLPALYEGVRGGSVSHIHNSKEKEDNMIYLPKVVSPITSFD